jgi:hypothetical protein
MASSSGGIWTASKDIFQEHARYQRVIYKLLSHLWYRSEGSELLGRSLIAIAAQAYIVRDIGSVELASQAVLALPVYGHTRQIAQYYQAVCISLRGDFAQGRVLLDQIIEQDSKPQLRSRALLTKAGTYLESGQLEQAASYYDEARRLAIGSDPFPFVESLRGIAIIRSIHGDHERALTDLEFLYPVARLIATQEPRSYYELINSIAVELGEVGRIDEALKVSSIVTSSPIAPTYPECHETHAELESKRATKRRSVIIIHWEPEPVAQPRTAQCLKQNRTSFWLKLYRLCSRSTSYRAPPALYILPVFITPIPIDSICGPKKPRAPPASSFRAN